MAEKHGPHASEKGKQDEQIVRNVIIPRRHPGRWIALVVLGLLGIEIGRSLLQNPNFHWDVFLQYLFAPTVIAGVGWTLFLTVTAMALAIICAGALILMRESDNPILRTTAWLWIWFFRGTPLYTQLLFWGLFAVLFPRLSISVPFGPEIFGVPTNWIITASVAAILGLGLNESAYLAEIFRAGFKSISPGQTEAAQAIGMSRGRIWWRILLPQAMRTIIPPTGNETIGMLKGTSLVLAVPFTLDLMFATNAIANRIYLPVPMLMVAGFWYLVVTSVLMIGQYYLERHFGKGQDVTGGRHV
ncbi:amino acid ABC transporter permease [Paracoccus caeni]|uniref:Amino acid ABC transporter permease n=1 Tax=Paracoccus caeni TaxID=657651 RepID=A0A934VVC6_9RHOB|nr:amino acid ABC transporter permease [Paracoccus caeni]MBK4216796.1 amino acid ABC transporter permease [Paracoccus caeni]